MHGFHQGFYVCLRRMAQEAFVACGIHDVFSLHRCPVGFLHGNGFPFFLGGADFLHVAMALHAGVALLLNAEHIHGVRNHRGGAVFRVAVEPAPISKAVGSAVF